MVSALIPPSISIRIVNPGIDQIAHPRHLVEHLGNETLPTKARFDRHHQQGVELAQHLKIRIQRGYRV